MRYSYNSPFAIQLRKIFETTSKIVEEYLANRVDKKLLVIPAANKEYLSVYASSVTNTLMIDCLRNH